MAPHLAGSRPGRRTRGFARKINHANVTDSHEVLVLAASTPNTYADDPRLEPPAKPKKVKRPKAKSAA